MKSKSCVLFLLIGLLAGCDSTSNPGFPALPSGGPAARPPADFGIVRMIFDRSSGIDPEREYAILKLVSASIKKQRNISMELRVVENSAGEPAGQLAKMIAAGDPPEIVQRSPNDIEINGFDKAAHPPLRLNEAIDEYGPNIIKIPDNCWEWSKVGDVIYSIPTAQAIFYTLVANEKTMKKYGWTIPASFIEFEDMLAEAKRIGLEPIRGFPYDVRSWFGIPSGLVYALNPPCLYSDEDGNLHPLCQMPEFYQYMETMRRWGESGYIVNPPLEGGADYSGDGWLFSVSYPELLGKTEGIEPVPLLAATASGPTAQQPFYPIYSFESYHNPEALVAFMDWVLDSEENNKLAVLGEEGVEYKMTGPGTYERLDDSWEWAYYFFCYGMFDWPPLNAPNAEAVHMVIADMERYAAPGKFYSLPLYSMRYAVPGSELAQAWAGERQYESKMNIATALCCAGEMTLDEYTVELEKNRELSEKYIRLTQAYMNREYNPESDLYVP